MGSPTSNLIASIDRAVQQLGEPRPACEKDKPDVLSLLLIEVQAIRVLLQTAADGGAAVRVMPIGVDRYGVPIFPAEAKPAAGQSLLSPSVGESRKS